VYTIAKQFTFDAAHKLDGLPDGHKCSELHGHTYTVEIRLSYWGLDRCGFVMDFGELAPFKEVIDTMLDHKYLNDTLVINPTAENIARTLHGLAVAMFPNYKIRIRVWETPKAWAEYGKD